MAIDGSQAPKIDGVRVEVAVVGPCDELLYDEEDEDARDEVLDKEESVCASWEDTFQRRRRSTFPYPTA